jgi:hypothetical protein
MAQVARLVLILYVRTISQPVRLTRECRRRRKKAGERRVWKMMKVVDGKLYDKHSQSIGITDPGLGLLILKTTLDLMTNYIALIIVTDDF